MPTTSAVVGRRRGAELDLDLVGAFDHVGVGQDVPFVVDHEARAGRDAAAARFSASPNGLSGDAVSSGASVGFDEGDALAVALVDLVDDVACRRLRLSRDRRRPAARATVRSPSSPSESIQPAAIAIAAEGGDDSAAEQGGAERSCGGSFVSCSSRGNCRGAASATPKRSSSRVSKDARLAVREGGARGCLRRHRSARASSPRGRRRCISALADQHRVDADPLELVQLCAVGDAGLGDDGLAGRHVGHQLVGRGDVDGAARRGRGC